jgi:hypothetical protein
VPHVHNAPRLYRPFVRQPPSVKHSGADGRARTAAAKSIGAVGREIGNKVKKNQTGLDQATPCACAVRDQLGRCHPYGDAPSDPERNEIHREKDDQARIPAPFVFNEQSDKIRQYSPAATRAKNQMIRAILMSLRSELHRMIATAPGHSYGNCSDLPE